MSYGKLVVQVFADHRAQPVPEAMVNIIGRRGLFNAVTGSSGQTPAVELRAPDIQLSFVPSPPHPPYASYRVEARKPGLSGQTIAGVQVYPGRVSFLDVYLASREDGIGKTQTLVIPDCLLGRFAPKIPEDERKWLPAPWPAVTLPAYLHVHDGAPFVPNTPQYRVSFADYIKTAAACEIYCTWPRECLKAYLLTLFSRTLNRVYTQWYESKGQGYDLTSSPQYDPPYSHGRNRFDTLSELTDQMLGQYIRRPDSPQPLYAQICDGLTISRPGWFSLWEAKELAGKGYDALQLIRYFYGEDVVTDRAHTISRLPDSYPGYPMDIGSCGTEVQSLQRKLNALRAGFPVLPLIANPDGIFDKETQEALKAFQRLFHLPVNGLADYATWCAVEQAVSMPEND